MTDRGHWTSVQLYWLSHSIGKSGGMVQLAAEEEADRGITVLTLPSWNEGPAKQAIVAFVKEITDHRHQSLIHTSQYDPGGHDGMV